MYNINISDVRSLVADILGTSVDLVNDDSGPSTIEQWDSLAHITIAAAVEEKFGVNIKMGDLVNIKNFSQLMKIIQDRCD